MLNGPIVIVLLPVVTDVTIEILDLLVDCLYVGLEIPLFGRFEVAQIAAEVFNLAMHRLDVRRNVVVGRALEVAKVAGKLLVRVRRSRCDGCRRSDGRGVGPRSGLFGRRRRPHAAQVAAATAVLVLLMLLVVLVVMLLLVLLQRKRLTEVARHAVHPAVWLMLLLLVLKHDVHCMTFRATGYIHSCLVYLLLNSILEGLHVIKDQVRGGVGRLQVL